MKKAQRVLRVENKLQGGKTKSQNPWYKSIFNKNILRTKHWSILFLLSIIAMLIVRFLAGLLLTNSEIGFVWQEIFKMVFAFMILGAIGSLTSSSRIGTAVSILLLLFFFFRIINHDYKQETNNDYKQEITTLKSSSAKKDSIFTKGVYYINVLGETPFYINIVSSRKYAKYSLRSETGNGYYVVPKDGSPIYDEPGLSVIFPYKKRPKFSLRSNQPTTIKMVVS
jgi:hypothetical protein